MAYKAVIGLEFHCEMKSNTKVFSSARNGYSKLSNEYVSAVDMAFPGMPCHCSCSVPWPLYLWPWNISLRSDRILCGTHCRNPQGVLGCQESMGMVCFLMEGHPGRCHRSSLRICKLVAHHAQVL